jgi:hypothetical protein
VIVHHHHRQRPLSAPERDPRRRGIEIAGLPILAPGVLAGLARELEMMSRPPTAEMPFPINLSITRAAQLLILGYHMS